MMIPLTGHMHVKRQEDMAGMQAGIHSLACNDVWSGMKQQLRARHFAAFVKSRSVRSQGGGTGVLRGVQAKTNNCVWHRIMRIAAAKRLLCHHMPNKCASN